MTGPSLYADPNYGTICLNHCDTKLNWNFLKKPKDLYVLNLFNLFIFLFSLISIFFIILRIECEAPLNFWSLALYKLFTVLIQL